MVIWSLFDGSGIMGLPWAQACHTIFCFNADGADHGEYEIKMQHENLHYVNHWIDSSFDPAGLIINPWSGMVTIGKPDIIFSFPSCTELAGSGEKHKRNIDSVIDAVSMARVAESLGYKYSCPWMVENPVGKLSTEWRKPDYYFDPFEYGGYLTGDEESFHQKMPSRDAYTKKTCIWCGNGFVMPDKNPVPHIGKFWGWSYLGGKSEKTKQLRSLTPRGFARAVYEANHG